MLDKGKYYYSIAKGTFWLSILLSLSFFSCENNTRKKLPYIGERIIQKGDTIYHTIPTFKFLNQDSLVISEKDLDQVIYIADFFYTYCPSVCPKVKNQMLRVYDKYRNDDRVKLVSFALDPKRDTPQVLKKYAENLGIKGRQWEYLSGDQDEIWTLAESFLISVSHDKEEPGGIFHSGKIILIDQNAHIRSFADGTNPNDVDAFLKDIDILLKDFDESN